MNKALISNLQKINGLFSFLLQSRRDVCIFYDASNIILMDFTVYGREKLKKSCKRINMIKNTKWWKEVRMTQHVGFYMWGKKL